MAPRHRAGVLVNGDVYDGLDDAVDLIRPRVCSVTSVFSVPTGAGDVAWPQPRRRCPLWPCWGCRARVAPRDRGGSSGATVDVPCGLRQRSWPAPTRCASPTISIQLGSFARSLGLQQPAARGRSAAVLRPVLRAADDRWWRAAYVNGFASGEAIIGRLSGHHDDDPENVTGERRALIFEPEFARLLTVNNRDGSTSSPILRGAWDDGRLQLIRAKSSLLAEGTHVSIVAHITPGKLREKLATVEVASGFANRFLFFLVRRSKRLPSGGYLDPAIIGDLGRRTREALDVARASRILRRTPDAEALWANVYHAEPDRDGLLGEITARWAAQMLRLSVVYALLDQAEAIDVPHVAAARAVWDYAVASARFVFGDATGNPRQDRLLEALRDAFPEGLDSTTIANVVFGKNAPPGAIDAAIRSLLERHLIEVDRIPTGGRPRLVYRSLAATEETGVTE